MLRVCLDDCEVLQLLLLAAEDFARGSAPAEVTQLFTLATMTAVSKTDGEVGGIATGTSFRRLVARTLARQFMKDVEKTCAPFQFALSTRAGTDCVGHAVRAMTDLDPRLTVLSIDGIGAYDHVFRSAFLEKLLEVEPLRPLLPFVRSVYSEISEYHWVDDEGRHREIRQQEGGEQGDPLMPLLFSLAVHNALQEVQAELLPGEWLFAFLDDVYALSTPERCRKIYDLLADRLLHRAGIRLHTGKTRTWNRAAEVPERMEELGANVWNPEGLKVLGTPVGTPRFHQAASEERLQKEEEFWRTIPWVCDLQCAWQLMLQCAGPRCHHFLRTVPPSLSAAYAAGHDRGMQQVMNRLLEGLPGDQRQQEVARTIASLPIRMGGLGIRSATRMAPAAYWASWADALPMLETRLPQVAQIVTRQLDSVQAPGCLGELQRATVVLDTGGFVTRPTWSELRAGTRPTSVSASEPGEWQHGWQNYASSSLEFHFRGAVVFAQSSAADQAHLRSHSGGGASKVLCVNPTKPEFTMAPSIFRTVVSERLRLHLSVTKATCACGRHLDSLGRHRAACPHSGKLRARAFGPEKTGGSDLQGSWSLRPMQR